jgi:beta-aspartyl-peptidase (threonine type)
MGAKFSLILGLAATFACILPGIGFKGSEVHAETSINPIVAIASSEEQSQSIRAVLSAQQAAWNRGDMPAFLESYWNSPELTFAGSDGIVRGYDGLLARYRTSYPDKQTMGELDFSGLEIRQLGPDAALVLGQWHLKRNVGDVGGVFTLVFQRFPDGWRIIHDHTSAQKQTP